MGDESPPRVKRTKKKKVGWGVTAARGEFAAAQLVQLEEEVAELLSDALPNEITAEELYAVVSDGSVLCRWLNHVHAGVVKGFREAPQGGQLKYFQVQENVNAAIRALRVLGVNEVQLFDASDLVEKKNWRKVLRAVVALGDMDRRGELRDPTTPLAAAPEPEPNKPEPSVEPEAGPEPEPDDDFLPSELTRNPELVAHTGVRSLLAAVQGFQKEELKHVETVDRSGVVLRSFEVGGDETVEAARAAFTVQTTALREALIRRTVHTHLGIDLPADFREEFRDGVIMCRLLNVLHPGAVARVLDASANAIVQRVENVQSFLAALPRVDATAPLFAPADLLDLRNWDGVVNSVWTVATHAGELTPRPAPEEEKAGGDEAAEEAELATSPARLHAPARVDGGAASPARSDTSTLSRVSLAELSLLEDVVAQLEAHDTRMRAKVQALRALHERTSTVMDKKLAVKQVEVGECVAERHASHYTGDATWVAGLDARLAGSDVQACAALLAAGEQRRVRTRTRAPRRDAAVKCAHQRRELRSQMRKLLAMAESRGGELAEVAARVEAAM